MNNLSAIPNKKYINLKKEKKKTSLGAESMHESMNSLGDP